LKKKGPFGKADMITNYHIFPRLIFLRHPNPVGARRSYSRLSALTLIPPKVVIGKTFQPLQILYLTG
jgi:hypothetical protein